MIPFFINSLRHRPERAYSRLGALEAQGFPMDQVHIVWGKYWGNFNSQDQMVDAAVADGFPELEGLRNAGRFGYVGAMWSFFRTFRAIQDSNIEMAVVFEDDFKFKRGNEYRNFKGLCRDLPNDSKIGILGYHPAEIRPNDVTRELDPVSQYWGKGVVNLHSSHNVANIYTPDGLQAIRDEAGKKRRLSTIEFLIGCLHGEPGVYSLLSPIISLTVAQGKSDAMPGEGTESEYSVSHVERWKSGYNVINAGGKG